MGRGAARSAPISAMAVLLVAGEGEGQLGVEGRHQRAVEAVPEPDPALLEGPLAGHEAELHAEELVEDEPAGGPVVVGLGLGLVDAVVGPGPVDQPEPRRAAPRATGSSNSRVRRRASVTSFWSCQVETSALPDWG